ncbi:hypothetical protein [Streptomyces sp. NBC_00328]|nr:hypothetical protein [Streptomyces sp. NBC_00328]
MRRELVQKKHDKKSEPHGRAPEEMPGETEQRPRPEVRKDIARTWWPDG